MKAQHVDIIAEAGVNHNGDMNIALDLIDTAADAGANFVKFQTFKSEQLVTATAEKALYQRNSEGISETQYEMLKRLELSFENHKVLIERCYEKNIGFLSSAFDLESLKFLLSLNLPYIKIPSGEINNLPYLREVGTARNKIILSTGMSNNDEITNAIEVLRKAGVGQERLVILHCNSEYPTPMQDVNLHAMVSLKEKFGNQVGYSDHTKGIEVPIAAVALGAIIVEKHFTISRNFEGPDHKASLEPGELAEMVRSIRNIEKAIGKKFKQPTPSEKANINAARKSIVAACPIKKGQQYTEKNLCIKRPGNGISPMRWDEVISLKANKDFQKDELISL